MENKEVQGKDIALIAYLTLVGLIIAFVMNSDKKYEFSNFHIKQSLGIAVTGFALGLIGIIPVLGWLVSILGVFLLFYMWIIGLINAINGKQVAVPVLGQKYNEWFKNL
ncbi:DUF4870 domain-containing protein [Flavobacterium sp. U410]